MEDCGWVSRTSEKVGKVIVFLKLYKDERLSVSYRPGRLLSAIAKLLKWLFLWRLDSCIEPRYELLGFRSQHSTTLATRMS